MRVASSLGIFLLLSGGGSSTLFTTGNPTEIFRGLPRCGPGTSVLLLFFCSPLSTRNLLKALRRLNFASRFPSFSCFLEIRSFRNCSCQHRPCGAKSPHKMIILRSSVGWFPLLFSVEHSSIGGGGWMLEITEVHCLA